jgi:hypothetical protein
MPNSKHLTHDISNLVSLINKTKLGLSVPGLDTGDGVEAGRDWRGHEGPLDAAALVDPDEPEVVEHLIGGSLGGWGLGAVVLSSDAMGLFSLAELSEMRWFCVGCSDRRGTVVYNYHGITITG